MNATVKPSVAVVPTCKPSKDNQFTQGVARGVVADAIARSASSRTVAWNPASNGTLGSAAFVTFVQNTWNTACSDGACDPHRATKTSTTRTATSARSVQFLSFQPTKQTKESIMMNRIMVSFFAVILAAFAVSAVMRERVKAEAECHAVEVAR